MKTILIILFLTLSRLAWAQDTMIVQLEYFLDADPGFGKATVMNVPEAQDGQFPVMVSVSGASAGYHKLYIRSKDKLGRWSLTASENIEVLPLDVKSVVTSGEYYFDMDPGFGAGAPINVTVPDTAILQNFAAVTAALTEGYHQLYLRFKDSYGNWSITSRKNIEVIKSEMTNVVMAEYFFDKDNGFGNCPQAIFASPLPDGSFSFNIPNSQVPPNADTLFIRVRNDAEEKWSLTQVKTLLTILPLRLLDFKAAQKEAEVLLSWNTENEVNTAYFIVERSTDGTRFNPVAKLPAKGNAAKSDYNFTDNVAGVSETKLYYRLRQLDRDGTFTYSNVATVDMAHNQLPWSISPNPASSYIIIRPGNNNNLSGAIMTLADAAGHALIKRQLSSGGDQQISTASLAKGVYFVSIVNKGDVQTQKLVIK